jgi:hypothetical protein
MSALGHKQTFCGAIGMSALPPKADMCGALAYVCFVPKADSCAAAKRSSFDHLVSAGEQRRGNFESKQLRSLKVDGQLELGRLLNWQIGRPFALEDSARVFPAN